MGRSNLTPSEIKAKKIISENLKNLLLKSGKKKIEIQRETNIPQSTLSDYFGGKTLPSVDNLQKLAKAFNVSVGNIDPRYNPTASKEASPTKTTYKDLGLPYKGVVPDDVNAMYRAIAETYAKEHPDHRYKLVSIDLTGIFVALCRQSVAKQKIPQEINLGVLKSMFYWFHY